MNKTNDLKTLPCNWHFGVCIRTLMLYWSVILKSYFSVLLTCFFCLLSALASWATRCLCCSSKSLLSSFMRDSTGFSSGDRVLSADWEVPSTNEALAVKVKKKKWIKLNQQERLQPIPPNIVTLNTFEETFIQTGVGYLRYVGMVPIINEDVELSTIPLLSAGDDGDSEAVVDSLGGLKAENGVAAGCVDCLANLCRGCWPCKSLQRGTYKYCLLLKVVILKGVVITS